MQRSFLRLLPSAIGACLIVLAMLQEYGGWPRRKVVECQASGITSVNGCLRYPMPKSLRGKKPGGASYVLQDGRRISGVLRTSGRVMADPVPHLAFTDKAVVWRPLAGGDVTSDFKIVVAPDFTFWFWIMLVCGAVPILHQVMIVRGGCARVRDAVANWERKFAAMPPARQNRQVTLGFFITLVLLCIFSGKISDFGYDGIWYAKIADRGLGVLDDGDDLAMHSMQRIAPMMLVHAVAVGVRDVLSATGGDVAVTEADRETGLKHFSSGCLLAAFYITGVAFLTAAAWSALCVFGRLQLSGRRKLTGFVLLFASFPIIRLFAYYPNLSDYYGFSLGVFSYHAFLARQRLVQIVIALVGTYTFPMVSVVSLGLLAASVEDGDSNSARLPLYYLAPLRWWIVGAVAAGSAFVFWRLAPEGAAIIAGNCTRPLPWLLPVSVGCCALYLGAVTSGFFTAIRSMKVRLIPWLEGGLLALVLLFAIQFSTAAVFGQLANGGQSFFWLLKVLSATSVIDPFCFLGAHFAYYGLVVVFAITAGGGMWAEAARRGLSMCLLLALLLVLSLMSESRCLSNVLPVIVFLVAGAMPESLSPGRCLIAQFLVCWTWLPLNQGATYFIPFGPWNEHWIAWLKIASLVAVVLLQQRRHILNDPSLPA